MTGQILVLGGGTSPEREVSLRSAAAVAAAAQAAGFDVLQHDPAVGLDILDTLPSDTVVLPVLHGAGGEDGVIQAALEQRGVRYLGTDAEHSRLCFSKILTRQRLTEHDVPMAKGAVVTKETYGQQQFRKAPHVLKVDRGGSSIGVLIVRDPDHVGAADIDAVFSLDTRAVLEELIEGIEISVPVLGITALPVIEIRPPAGGEFDYENKYNGKTEELCPPQSISTSVQEQAQRLAEKVHAVMGCRHLSRTDMIVAPSGNIVVLEINTMPGLTNQSLLPKSAAVAGTDMPHLVQRFVQLVTEES